MTARSDTPHLLVLGLGYSGRAIAAAAGRLGWRVTVTSRDPGRHAPPAGVALVAFDAAPFAAATHVVQTAAPDDGGDPALSRFGPQAVEHLRWAGYLSTTGVYGDRNGGWVDEDTAVAPVVPRAQRRVAAEQAWVAAVPAAPVDVFRLAGIYGPGRSAFDEVRAGTARRVDKPGHLFGRIHRDDIAAAVVAAMQQGRDPGARVLNLADDEPASSADVTAEAARLLGLPPPPLIPFEAALATMSPMGRSFWSENRRVRSQKTKDRLGLQWLYPTYREGLRAILQQERAEGAA
ncbi:MAG: SDR family NAD(P)-dependent oxidoreductase [Gemmatimonadaceae bacterium]|nr:SDR family NAD(P)-dependent oxidoreductase [Acetobacteraceae bacterium]